MFDGLRNTAATLKALKLLCESASEEAALGGRAEIGAEHFLLAAFSLTDGTAQRAFAGLGIDAEAVRAAVERQYGRALAFAGLPEDAMPRPLPLTRRPSGWTLPTCASGRSVLQHLSKAGPGAEPLCGAGVVLAALTARHGIVPRTLRELGIDPAMLATVAQAELATHRQNQNT